MTQNTANATGAPVRRTAHTIHYNLSYMVQGEEHGTDGAIILLHDFPANATVWTDILPQLAGLNRAVYAIDMLGYGQSDQPWPADTSVWGQADCLLYLFQDLNLTNMILVGHGFGGGVAQILAARLCRDRTDALVLIDTICYTYSFAPNWPLTDMAKRQDPEAAQDAKLADVIDNLRETLPNGSQNPQRFNAFMGDYVSQWDSDIGKEVLFQQIRNLVPSYINSVSTDLKLMEKPVLIIWGEKDQQVPLKYGQRLHREIPDSGLVVVPDAGHLVLFDASGAVVNAITDFVGSLS